MGLLGESWDDPKTQATLMMAAGLLGGGGFGQAMGRGLQGYQSVLSNAEDRANSKLMRDAQLEAMKDAAKKRELDMQQAQFKQRLIQSMGLLGEVPVPDSMQVGPVQGGADVPYPNKPQQSIHSVLTDPSKLAQLKMAGVDLSDVAKLAQPNWQNINGNLVNTNAPGFKGGFQPGMHITPSGQAVLSAPGPNGMPVVGAAPGSLETVGAFQRQEQNIKNENTLLPLDYRASSGTPLGGTIGDYLKAQQGLQGQQISPADRAAILADAQKNGITNPVISPNWNYGQQATAQRPTLQSPAEAAAAEAAAKLAPKAQEDINTTWLASAYKPTVESGNAATQILGNVSIARSSLANIGQTGWGTEAKANAVSVLSSLGIAPKSAEMFAANVQTFQNVAMTNLKTQLDAATGPQTEGDADRASKLFAQLKNTPQANAFILDVMEAKAQRDAAKAKFYQGALPIAQKSGDLASVDREWLQRAPSVFDMPSMKKWGVK